MKFNRIRFSKEVAEVLTKMKGRLGLNWNLMCRIGFCLSLGDPTDINPEEYKADGSIEIERKILTGEEDQLYVALLIQRCMKENIQEDNYFEYFRAHMNRGVLLFAKRVGNFKDLAQLIQ